MTLTLLLLNDPDAPAGPGTRALVYTPSFTLTCMAALTTGMWFVGLQYTGALAVHCH